MPWRSGRWTPTTALHEAEVPQPWRQPPRQQPQGPWPGCRPRRYGSPGRYRGACRGGPCLVCPPCRKRRGRRDGTRRRQWTSLWTRSSELGRWQRCGSCSEPWWTPTCASRATLPCCRPTTAHSPPPPREPPAVSARCSGCAAPRTSPSSRRIAWCTRHGTGRRSASSGGCRRPRACSRLGCSPRRTRVLPSLTPPPLPSRPPPPAKPAATWPQ
mmetsp:Transcript_118759/g.378748  ORF Transcript_118759/g.378748 Transcript_118759/m.378748 type:complete len:214 (-) Transcript_118759:206-847(-)